MEFTGERMIPEWNINNEIYLEHMIRYLFASQFARGKTVLDVACGSGYGSNYLLKAGAHSVVGIDISEETISYCRTNYSDKRLHFFVGDVGKIPLHDKGIDLVVSMETIEHVDEITQNIFLNEVKRVLNPEGIFIVSTPNSLVSQKGNPFHLKEFSLEEFQLILKQYFSHVQIYYQDNIESSFILLKDTLDNEILLKNNDNILMRKINVINSSESMYLIAICSNFDINQNINEYITISNIKTLDCWKTVGKLQEVLSARDRDIKILQGDVQTLQGVVSAQDGNIQTLQWEIGALRGEIQGLQQEVASRDAWLSSIYQSLSWKLTSPLRTVDRWLKIRQ
jgi:2-polyprenyl-3-methyl-5-hydroxy-6-metoxy-1,4-benzoquinol methylase